MLEGEPGHQDSLLRTEYAIKALTDGGVEVERLARDTANWNRAQAAARMRQWLEDYGDQIEVILSNNDDMALGAIDALSETDQELEDWPLIVGVDATAPALEAVAAGSGTAPSSMTPKGRPRPWWTWPWRCTRERIPPRRWRWRMDTTSGCPTGR